MPEQFGGFKNNLTLIGLVCSECNDRFGKTLELSLGRGGLEGWLRLRHGQKPEDETYQFNSSGFRISLYAPEEPLWNGEEIILDKDGERPLTAVAMRSRKEPGESQWVKLTESELEELNSIEDLKLEKPIEIQLLAPPIAVKERLIEKLKSKGVDIKEWSQVKNIDQNALVNGTLDPLRQRAITKIAINYLAKTFGKALPQLIYSPDLLKAKQFVIDGTDPDYRIVSLSERVHAIDEGERISIQAGHLISLGFGPFFGRHSILCQVSIYNQLTYLVALSPDYKGVLLPTRAAHYWRLADMTCKKVTPLDIERRLPLPFVAT